MSQENVEIVRRVYEAFDRLDEPHVLGMLETGLVDPDAELDFGTAYPDGPVVRLATLSRFLDTMPWGRSLRFEPESFRATSADQVLVFVRLHAVGGESGVEVEGRYAHLLTLRDKRVVRVEVYSSRTEALEAAVRE